MLIRFFNFFQDNQSTSKSDKVTSSCLDRSVPLGDTDLLESSGSEFELDDNDVNSSDSEWSTNDNVVLTVLKKGSKYQKSSDSDDDDGEEDLCLAVLRQRARSQKTCDTKSDNASSVDIVNEILDSLVSNLPIDSLSKENTRDIAPQNEVPKKRKRNESEWSQKKG